MKGVFGVQHEIESSTLTNGVLLILGANTFTEILSASITSNDATNQQIDAYLCGVSAGTGGGGTSLSPVSTESSTSVNVVLGGPFISLPTLSSPVFREGQNALSGWRYEPTEEERLTGNAGGALGIVLYSLPLPISLIIRLTWRERG